MNHLNNPLISDMNIAHIKGTLHQRQRVSRGDSVLILMLLMMLAYILSEALKNPFEEHAPLDGTGYGALLLSMLAVAMVSDYIASSDIRAVLKELDNPKLDEDKRIKNVDKALAWVDQSEPAKSLVHKCARPILFTANGIAGYAIAGESGVAMVAATILTLKINELHQNEAIPPRIKTT